MIILILIQNVRTDQIRRRRIVWYYYAYGRKNDKYFLANRNYWQNIFVINYYSGDRSLRNSFWILSNLKLLNVFENNWKQLFWRNASDLLFYSNHNVFKSEISFIIAANHTLSDNVLIIDDPMVKPIVQK